MHGRLGGRSVCLFKESVPENQVSLNKMLFLLGSAIAIVVLSKPNYVHYGRCVLVLMMLCCIIV